LPSQAQKSAVSVAELIVAQPPARQIITERPRTAIREQPAIARSDAIELPFDPMPTAKFPKCADQRIPVLLQPLCSLEAAGLDN
jgi:hypothetical protein